MLRQNKWPHTHPKSLGLEISKLMGFPGGSGVKNPPVNAGDSRDVGFIPGSGRIPGEGNGNPLQYSCLENSVDRGALLGYSPWGCKKSDMTENTHTYTHMAI